MKFKLDENLSPSLSVAFAAAGREAHSIVQQSLGGENDERVVEICAREGRALVTLDLDLAQIPQYPPANYLGIVVLRLANQSHLNVERAAASMLELLSRERLTGRPIAGPIKNHSNLAVAVGASALRHCLGQMDQCSSAQFTMGGHTVQSDHRKLFNLSAVNY